MKLLLNRFLNDPSHEYASVINAHRQLRLEHSHDYYELFLVNHGSATHRVNGVSQRLSRRTLVFVRPDDHHGYTGMSPDFEIINMLVPVPTLHALFEYLGSGFDSQRLLSAKLPPVAQLSPDDFRTLVEKLEQLVLSKKLMRERSDSSFRITLLHIFVTCFPLTPSSRPKEIPVWLRWLALEMMKKDNFIEGLPAMKRMSGKSQEHLSRECRKHLHRTPTEFVNELRVEHNARCLVSTDAKIIDLCIEAGFASLSYFYRLFRKRYGMSPREFRKRAGTVEVERMLSVSPVIATGIPKGIEPEAWVQTLRTR